MKNLSRDEAVFIIAAGMLANPNGAGLPPTVAAKAINITDALFAELRKANKTVMPKDNDIYGIAYYFYHLGASEGLQQRPDFDLAWKNYSEKK